MVPQFPELKGKVCVITGATSGIGKEVSVELARQGARVVMAGRASPKADAALAEVKQRSNSNDVEFIPVDLLSLQDTRRFARDVKAKHPKIDVLVNNAGGMFHAKVQSADGLEGNMALMLVAPFVLTQELFDALKAAAPARVINVATKIPPFIKLDFNDFTAEKSKYNGFNQYGRAKLALIMLTREMGRRYREHGVMVNSFHPGVILGTGFAADSPEPMKTIANLIGKFVSSSMEQGISTPVYLAGSPEAKATSGQYFIRMKPAALPKQAQDDALCQRVWTVVEDLSRGRGQAKAAAGA